MINVKRSILAISLLSISNFPALSMEDFDESKINHIRTRNTEKINKYNKKIEVYLGKIKEIEEVEELFKNLSIRKGTHASKDIPKPNLSAFNKTPILPSISKINKPKIDKDDSLSSDDEDTQEHLTNPQLMTRDPNPFASPAFTSPKVKKSQFTSSTKHKKSSTEKTTPPQNIDDQARDYLRTTMKEQRISQKEMGVRLGYSPDTSTGQSAISRFLEGGSSPGLVSKIKHKWKEERDDSSEEDTRDF